MNKEDKIKLFEEQSVRTHWDENQEKWFFSVQDVVQLLSESKDIKQYIKKMRSRNSELNSNWGTICTPIQMMAADGEMRKIQAADTEGILRLKQLCIVKYTYPLISYVLLAFFSFFSWRFSFMVFSGFFLVAFFES